MGCAFRIMKMPTLLPCFSFYRGCQMTINFGPTFKHKPVGFYGLNPTINATQKKSLLNIFLKYHKKGTTLADSMSRDVIKMKGVQSLVEDVGSSSPMDPHLLLLAWKLRSKKFCEFYDNEWMVLWANEQASTIEEIKAAVERWRKEIQTNDSSYKSFYNFVFDYLRSEKGTMCTALEKDDAIYAWTLLGFEKKFKYFKQWQDYWAERKTGVNRDAWVMILKLIESPCGTDLTKFDPDEGGYPLVIDEFIEYVLEKK